MPRRRAPQRGSRIGGRYVLEALLGEGGAGEVWRAVDERTQRKVAVKLIHEDGAGTPIQIRSEISILRLHGFAGVVRLLDEGAGEAPPFIVMELVSGEPFPGKARFKRWDAIASTTLTLVETLARLHGEGVVHLDIKPDNVLVSLDGAPTLLDFGIASDRRLRPITNEGYLLGTIAFMAPERLLRTTLEARAPALPSADLYSLGVLLFYALSGQLPHDAEDMATLIRACTQDPAPSLMKIAPETPRPIAGLVDLLLSKDPNARPRSAREVMSLLRGGPLPPASGPLINLDAGATPALVDRMVQGRAVDLVGPRLTGRTFTLDAACAELTRRGCRVVSLKPGKRRDAFFSGVAPLVGSLSEHDALSAPRLFQILSSSVEERLAKGLVVLADDVDQMDEASQILLAQIRRSGAVARVLEQSEAEPEGRITLAPLPEAHLARLFNGPERLLHLRARAARELYRATGGIQARVAAVIPAWIRAGIARWEGGALTVSPDLLERLEARLPASLPEDLPSPSDTPLSHALRTLSAWLSIAWPNATIEVLSDCLGRPYWQTEMELADLVKRGLALRRADGSFEPAPAGGDRSSSLFTTDDEREAAHAAIAGRLEPGVYGRFFHLLSALGDVPSEAMILDLAEESIAAARRVATDGGDLRQGFTVLNEALIHLRRSQPLSRRRAALELRLLATWVDLALADGTAPVLGLVYYEVGRARRKDRVVKQMDELVAAAIAYSAGGDRAHTLIEGLEPLEDIDLERRRQGLRALAARRCRAEVEDRVIADVVAWGTGVSKDSTTEARLSFWIGWWHYRRGRYREAAERHALAARRDPWLLGRISANIACASALMEVFSFEEARGHAETALLHAKGCGSPYIEARAEWVRRALAYRLGEAEEPDLELVAAAGALGMRDIEAAIAYTEASIAYRARRLDVAQQLALRAHELWEFVHDPWTSLLAKCLAMASGREVSKGDAAALVQRALDCPLKGIGIQALALAAEAGAAVPEIGGQAALGMASATPREHWDKRRETLSIAEALDRLTAHGTST